MEAFYTRVMARISGVVDGPDGIGLQLMLPGWNPHRHVLVPVEQFPDGMLDAIEHSPGPAECHMSLLAIVNMAASRAAELDWSGPFELHRSEVVDDDSLPLERQVVRLGVDCWDADGDLLPDVDAVPDEEWTVAREQLSASTGTG